MNPTVFGPPLARREDGDPVAGLSQKRVQPRGGVFTRAKGPLTRGARKPRPWTEGGHRSPSAEEAGEGATSPVLDVCKRKRAKRSPTAKAASPAKHLCALAHT